MKNLIQFILFAVIFAAITSCSSNPDPIKLFDEADLAANKNNTAQFTIKFENIAEGKKMTTSTKVFVNKLIKDKDTILQYRVEEPGLSTVTYDGTSFVVTDFKTKTMSQSTNAEMTKQLAENYSSIFYMIIDSRIDTAVIHKQTKNLSLLGKVDINGDNCFEISQKADGHGEYKVENKYCFSADDHLMKRYTSKIVGKDKKVMQEIQLTISNLVLNEKIQPNLFTQAIDSVNFKYENLDLAHDMNGHGEMTDEEMQGHGSSHQESAPGLLPTGSVAPDWTLLDAKGTKISLSQLKGKVVVLDFWATWCNPCKKVMPVIQKMYDTFKSKGVIVYGINTWERDDAVKFMKNQKFTYGLLLKGDDVAKNYKVEGIPTLYVIDKSGKIVFAESGAMDDTQAKLEAAIKKSL